MLNGKKKGSTTYTILLIVLVIVFIFAILSILPKPQSYKGTNPLLKQGDMPILVAHRGGDEEFPGNTLEAFYNAYSVDNRVIMETDANITKDGVLILCHETYLDKRTNASGEIIDWNYTDMIEQKVNFGYNHGEIYKDYTGFEVKPRNLENHPEGLEGRDDEIYLATTFEELLLVFPNNTISIEIKQKDEAGLAAMREAIRIVEKHNAFDRVIFSSFNTEIGREYKRLCKSGEVPENFMYAPSLVGIIKYVALYYTGLDVFYRQGISALHIPMEDYGFNFSSKRFIKFAHKHNIAVHYYTINDEGDMRKLIENGADAIMTDRPHLLKEVLDSYNK